jgi:hypothetical protein
MEGFGIKLNRAMRLNVLLDQLIECVNKAVVAVCVLFGFLAGEVAVTLEQQFQHLCGDHLVFIAQVIIVFPEKVFKNYRQFRHLFSGQYHKGLTRSSEDPFPGYQMLRQKMLKKEPRVEGKHKSGAIEGTILAGLGHFLGDDQQGILFNRETEVPDGLLAISFFYQRYKKLRLAICRDHAIPCLDYFFEPVYLETEPVFEVVIHVDDALMGVFSKCVTIFFNDNCIIGIFHNLSFRKATFGVGLAIVTVDKEAKSVAGTFVDRFCRPGDQSGSFAV